MKIIPTPHVLSFSAGNSFWSSAQGMRVISPAPSPEMLSDEHAPRCSMHPSAVRAWETVSCFISFFRLAMNPTCKKSMSEKRGR